MDEHRQHIYLGEPEEDLIDGLEPDQLVSAMDQPVPRRHFSRPVSAALWMMRIVLVSVTGLVVYTFVVAVVRGG